MTEQIPRERIYTERRFQTLFIGEFDLLAVLNGRNRIANIPDGSTIERAFIQSHRQGIGVLIANPEFAPVETGTEPPMLVAQFEAVSK